MRAVHVHVEDVGRTAPLLSLPYLLKAESAFEPRASSARLTDIHAHAWLLYVGAGIRTQVSMFAQQELYPPSHLSALFPSFCSRL